MSKSYKADHRPSLQFYPDDWLAEAGLRLCSLEARGLWVDMLCWMFKAPIRGSLQANDKQISSKELAKLEGENEEVIVKLLKELEDNKVFSKLENGMIINRRMYYYVQRQLEIQEVRIRAGRLGGKAKGKQKIKPSDSKKVAKRAASSPTPSSSPTPIVLKEEPIHPVKPDELAVKPYKITTPIQRIVCGYKMAKGIEYNDADWDKLNFKRCSSSAKKLLTYLKDVDKVIDCISDIGGELEAKGLDWTIETVCKRADEWKRKKEEK